MKQIFLGLAVFALSMSIIFFMHWGETKENQEKAINQQFEAVFGTPADNREVAQSAVTEHLQNLANVACEKAKHWHVFPADNYQVETAWTTSRKRMESAEQLAIKKGYEVPSVIARFRNHPNWSPGTRLEDLKCW